MSTFVYILLLAALGLLAADLLRIAYLSFREADESYLGLVCAGFVVLAVGTFVDDLLVAATSLDRVTVATVETAVFVLGFAVILVALRR